MHAKHLTVSPETAILNGVRRPMPHDEFELLDLFKGVTDLVVEAGEETGDYHPETRRPIRYRTPIPGRLVIPGQVVIQPDAVLEVLGPLRAGVIIGAESAAIFVDGDLSVRSIKVNPGRSASAEPFVNQQRAPDYVPTGIVVGGLLDSQSVIQSERGGIIAHDLRAKEGITAGGSIKASNDIHTTFDIRAGREIVAGGIIYAPAGVVSAGKNISAQLLYAKAFYPGIPWDLAVSLTDNDRSVFGDILKGRLVGGLVKEHPRKRDLPLVRLPATLRDILEERVEHLAAGPLAGTASARAFREFDQVTVS
jgi:hypothetical protein